VGGVHAWMHSLFFRFFKTVFFHEIK
jgi:hypothetical protein